MCLVFSHVSSEDYCLKPKECDKVFTAKLYQLDQGFIRGSDDFHGMPGKAN